MIILSLSYVFVVDGADGHCMLAVQCMLVVDYTLPSPYKGSSQSRSESLMTHGPCKKRRLHRMF
jgi:hypothetical protein